MKYFLIAISLLLFSRPAAAENRLDKYLGTYNAKTQHGHSAYAPSCINYFEHLPENFEITVRRDKLGQIVVNNPTTPARNMSSINVEQSGNSEQLLIRYDFVETSPYLPYKNVTLFLILRTYKKDNFAEVVGIVESWDDTYTKQLCWNSFAGLGKITRP
jgi:hypothetical protein